MSCPRSCVKCLGLVPWASLIALVISWAGTALFCGTGHAALTLSLDLLNNASITGFNEETSLVDDVFQAFKYAIYGIAGYIFVFTILLFVDGILATREVKTDVVDGCRTKKCCLCVSFLYTALTYVTSVGWLLMSAFAALPLYFYQVSNTQCRYVIDDANATDVCVDFIQAGLMPYKSGAESGYGELCGEDLKIVCEDPNYSLSYQMYMIAFAGACIALLGMKHFLMTLSANFAYIKMERKLCAYQDAKFREEMELNDIINTARSNERLHYKY